MKTKPTVGQKLFSLNIGNACNQYQKQELTAVVVKTVGRKYFVAGEPDCSKYQDTQYHIDGWREKTDYSATSFLYETEQEWEDEREVGVLYGKIGSYFKWNSRGLPLGKLREIKAILDRVE